MSLETFRKAMAISYATVQTTLPDAELEEMSLILTMLDPTHDGTSPPGVSPTTTAQVIDYIFRYGAWVREKHGDPILINGASMTIANLSHWEDRWPSQLSHGKDVLDQDAKDALQWIDDCGGSMAQENLPEARSLIECHLAKEGPLDKFSRKTIVAVGTPQQSPKKKSPPDTGWFFTMPDIPTDDILLLIESVREKIWNLTPCQVPVEYKPPITADELECGLLDCDAEVGYAHSGFILCNARTYASLRKFGRGFLDIELRKTHIKAGIMGRIHDAVIIIRSNTELEDGHIIFADQDLQYTCTYIPET